MQNNTARKMKSVKFERDCDSNVIRIGDRVEYDNHASTIERIENGLIYTSATGWALPYTVRKVG